MDSHRYGYGIEGMIKHLIILLLVGAACYGGVNWMYRQLDDGFSKEKPSGSAADNQASLEKNLSENTGQTTIDTELITRRNIFLVPDAAEGADSGNDPLASLQRSSTPDLILIGTVVHTDGDHRAIIYRVDQEKQLLVKEGDVINGVSIKQILPGKTIVSRQGRSEMLDIAAASELRRAKQNVINVKSAPPAAPDSVEDAVDPIDAEQPDEDGQPPLQVDPGTLGKISDGTIIKGRISR